MDKFCVYVLQTLSLPEKKKRGILCQGWQYMSLIPQGRQEQMDLSEIQGNQDDIERSSSKSKREKRNGV